MICGIDRRDRAIRLGEQTMSEQRAHEATSGASPSQDTLARLWEEHMRHEFQTKSAEGSVSI
jgi:hypothetical protein